MFLVNHSRRAFLDARRLMPEGDDPFTNALTRYGPLSALALLISIHDEDLEHTQVPDLAGAWAADPIEVSDHAPPGYEDMTAAASDVLSRDPEAARDLSLARGEPDPQGAGLDERLRQATWAVLGASDRFIHPEHARRLKGKA